MDRGMDMTIERPQTRMPVYCQSYGIATTITPKCRDDTFSVQYMAFREGVYEYNLIETIVHDEDTNDLKGKIENSTFPNG